MTENEKLRALLAEARTELDKWAPKWSHASLAVLPLLDAVLSAPADDEAARFKTYWRRVFARSCELSSQLVQSEAEYLALVEKNKRLIEYSNKSLRQNLKLMDLVEHCEEGFEAVRRSNHERGHTAADEMMKKIRETLDSLFGEPDGK